MDSSSAAFPGVAIISRDPSREVQSFRGLMIGIAVSAVLWAPLGIVVMRLF